MKFDVIEIARNVKEDWVDLDIVRVNDSILRLAVIKGEYHWHKHANDDELFFVYDGEMILETREGKYCLKRGQGFLVPKNTEHKTSSKERSIVLMVERPATVSSGD